MAKVAFKLIQEANFYEKVKSKLGIKELKIKKNQHKKKDCIGKHIILIHIKLWSNEMDCVYNIFDKEVYSEETYSNKCK